LLLTPVDCQVLVSTRRCPLAATPLRTEDARHRLLESVRYFFPAHEPMDAPIRSRRAQGQALIVLLGLLSTLGPFSNDSFLPVFPSVQREFGIGDLQMQQALTAYFLPFAVMMLLHGAFSDAFGRRRMIIVGMGAYGMAASVVAFAPSFEVLLLGRFLQGVSAGAGIVVSRAIVRDVYEHDEAQRALALVMIIFGVAPALAPILGGWIGHWFGWRTVFSFLSLLGAVLLVASVIWLPETLPLHRRTPFSLGSLAAGLRSALSSARFVLLTGAYACNFAGFFIYIVSAPQFGYRILGIEQTEFVWIFGPAIIGMIMGSVISGRLAGRMSAVDTVFVGYVLMFAAALFNVTFHSYNHASLPVSVLPLLVYTIGMGAAMPSLMLLVLDLMPQRRGLASSVIGFAQSGSSALLAGGISHWVSGSARSLALCSLVILGCALALWLSYLARIARRRPRDHA
jgi:DHA1 family bicyclomycin/chloramphenicol resistance-like MFS transporter